jgi:hypothetical protein
VIFALKKSFDDISFTQICRREVSNEVSNH